MARFLLITAVSWLAAVAAFVIYSWAAGGTASRGDVLSLLYWGGIVAVLSAAVVFVPVMHAMRHKFKTMWPFVAVGAILSLAPLVLFAILWNSLSLLISGIGALLFTVFLIFGACFGAGFHRAYVRFTAILFLALMTAHPPAHADAQAPPEFSLHLQQGQLALGPYALGMTVAEAESRHGRSLQLRPNVDDTGQCEGFDGTVSVGGHTVNLTFTTHADGLRIRNIFVRFSKVRDLDDVAAEVSRRVPTLRIAEHDPLIKGNKTAWTLSGDPLQTVLIGVREGLWISRGCVNGL